MHRKGTNNIFSTRKILIFSLGVRSCRTDSSIKENAFVFETFLEPQNLANKCFTDKLTSVIKGGDCTSGLIIIFLKMEFLKDFISLFLER